MLQSLSLAIKGIFRYLTTNTNLQLEYLSFNNAIFPAAWDKLVCDPNHMILYRSRSAGKDLEAPDFKNAKALIETFCTTKKIIPNSTSCMCA